MQHHLQGPLCALMMYAPDGSISCSRYAGPITTAELMWWLDQNHTPTHTPTSRTHNCYNLVSQVWTHSHYFHMSTWGDAVACQPNLWPELHITIAIQLLEQEAKLVLSWECVMICMSISCTLSDCAHHSCIETGDNVIVLHVSCFAA